MLYVVATPIGNLSDMSPRAVETLKSVDAIAAEDTRVTRKLLTYFGIQTPLISCHEHNEHSRSQELVQRMLAGQHIALVTDAGTPAISDPGAKLVRAATEAGIEVVAVPGPSAFAAALSVSGCENKEFTFFGFLPRNQKELKEKLAAMAGHVQTAVVYESPHRVLALLTAVGEVFPGIPVSASCELTKKFERTLRGTVEEVHAAIAASPSGEKGEYCLVFDLSQVPTPPAQPTVNASLEAQLLDLQLSGLDARAASQTLMERGESRNEVYRAALRLRQWAGNVPSNSE